MKAYVNRRSILRYCMAIAAITTITGSVLGGAAPAQAQSAVYTSTNAAAGNSVVAFQRQPDGALTSVATYPTGGIGTGAGLGNQGALALSESGNYLFVVNAGSDDISVFDTHPHGLSLRWRVPSGGSRPVSVTVHDRVLYVLNAGTPNSITGFSIQHNGNLIPIPGSTRSLSDVSTNPAQISFAPSGKLLVVTEKATNILDVFAVDKNGVAGPRVQSPSFGGTPFGFSFDPKGRLLVSEASTSSISSYYVSAYGVLPITGAVSTLQAAPCWVAVSKDGDYVYTGNAGMSRSITGLLIEKSGELTNSAVVATGLSGCTDLAVNSNGRFLYALENQAGSVRSFRMNKDGSLTFIGSYGSLGSGFTGLVAR